MYDRNKCLVLSIALISLAALLLVSVVAAAPAAQAAEPPAPPQLSTLVGFLQMLAGGSIVGAAIAFLFERFQWFQNLTGNARFWTILVLSVGLPVVAQVLLQLVPADVWVKLEPYWHALLIGLTGWVGSQLAHRLQRQPS